MPINVTELLNDNFVDPKSTRGLSHTFLCALLKARNYRITKKGVCYGFAGSLALANLMGEIDVSDGRIKLINTCLIKNHLEAYNKTLVYFNTEGHELLAALASEKEQSNLLGDYYIKMQSELLDRDTQNSIDINGYFDVIAIIQAPKEHHIPQIKRDENLSNDLFLDDQNIEFVLPTIIPAKLEEAGGSSSFSSFGLSFNESEFTQFLNSIKNNIIDQLDGLPLSFIVEANSHGIFFGYDIQSKQWVTGDANALPNSPVVYFSETADLSKRIINAYRSIADDKTNLSVSMNIRLMGLQFNKNKLQNSWSKIQLDLLNAISTERLRRRDGIGRTALDLSIRAHASDWATKLLEKNKNLTIADLTDDQEILERLMKVDIPSSTLEKMLALKPSVLQGRDVYGILSLALTNAQWEKIKLLQEAGADINDHKPDDLPLMVQAATLEELENLLKLGGDPNASYQGKSVLFEAIFHKDLDRCLLLIRHGANLDLTETNETIRMLNNDQDFKYKLLSKLDELAMEAMMKIKHFIIMNKSWGISKFQWKSSAITLDSGEKMKVPEYVKLQWDEMNSIEKKHSSSPGECWGAYQKIVKIGKSVSKQPTNNESIKKYYSLFQTASSTSENNPAKSQRLSQSKK